jgi:hypothetical protein
MFSVIIASFHKKRMLVFYDLHRSIYDCVSIVSHYVIDPQCRKCGRILNGLIILSLIVLVRIGASNGMKRQARSLDVRKRQKADILLLYEMQEGPGQNK